MRIESTALKQMLAAEFVLGTLHGGARRRFERWLRQDRWLRGEVRYWEERFAGIGALDPQPPRAVVWTQIRRRMHAQETPRAAAAPKLAGLFDAWRAWAMLATAASAVLAILLIRTQLAPPAERIVEVSVRETVETQTYVAALRLPDEEAQWTISIAPDAATLRLATNAPARLANESDYELWWVTESGATSLGLLPREGRLRRPLPAGLAIGEFGQVAVSLEPAGGAPAGGGPTGPVLVAAPLLPSL